jgi:hypothetical protein
MSRSNYCTRDATLYPVEINVTESDARYAKNAIAVLE